MISDQSLLSSTTILNDMYAYPPQEKYKVVNRLTAETLIFQATKINARHIVLVI